jgi:hypothetical protein
MQITILKLALMAQKKHEMEVGKLQTGFVSSVAVNIRATAITVVFTACRCYKALWAACRVLFPTPPPRRRYMNMSMIKSRVPECFVDGVLCAITFPC